eukprot:TRINITY_DN5027_c0_g1_i1.p1 TRINITY_DN5027_c0_g1~~TRINITY_DN5027_c0_g1_i1.p1  ORF type:complete len:674 (-),score=139.15 TRINITY_DN5027_c0_g1_i1:177-2198(-)
MYRLNSFSRSTHALRRAFSTGQNRVEKIVQKFAVNLSKEHIVHSGDYITVRPQQILTHDNTSAVMQKFKEFFSSPSQTHFYNCKQPMFALDHDIQNKSEKNLKKYKNIETFARTHGVDFYPAGRGIGHQVMCEEGYAWPGTLVVASDSHSNMYGGLGCLGTPIVRTDAAAIWATGQTWWQVPRGAKVELTGHLRRDLGVSGKDVIITLAGLFNKDELLNHAAEFHGEGVNELTLDERLTIANMSTEWGCLTGVFPIDNITLSWLKKRIDQVGPSHPRLNISRLQLLEKERESLEADKNAQYNIHVRLDLSTVRPHVSGPNAVKKMSSLADIEEKKVKINKAYLLSCTNGRLEDLAAAAKIVKGKKVASGVQFYVAPASTLVQKAAEEKGYWQALIDCGAYILPPSCGPCIGLGKGLLEKNEVGISATNRNFKGRMGHPTSQVYLASPATVSASAIKGYVASPFPSNENVKPKGEVISRTTTPPSTSKTEVLSGFPEQLKGELVFCYIDNMNTDGIYPGKYTYDETISPEKQGQVAMENYDPSFSKRVASGSVLVGGFNFGTGSSREQAATALKYKGIRLVVAGSFNDTYKRNALNNGFLCVECPALVNNLKKSFGTKELTVLTGKEVTVDFANSKLSYAGETYSIGPVGPAAQNLVLCGGLENAIKKQLKEKI